MNWIRENKFLSGFIAILVVGAGGLGYLLYTAWGSYSDVSDQYTSLAGALHTLQIRVPYPDQQNLVKYRAERDSLIDATHSLATSLSQMELPVDPMTPSAFQDRLRETVSAVVAKAGQSSATLPDHFSLDFDKYQTSPPSAEAAPALGRQLAALKIAVDILLDDRVDNIISLQRTPLPQESGRPGGGGGRREVSLVDKVPFEVRFTASQASFQKVLNDFAASSRQYFITRALLVENSDPKPKAKTSEAAPAVSLPVATGTDASVPGSPDTSGSNGFLTFIVGTEKVNVDMRIDMTTFNPPAHR